MYILIYTFVFTYVYMYNRFLFKFDLQKHKYLKSMLIYA